MTKNKSQTLIIGLLGLPFQSGNKGCAALAYSFLQILREIAIKNNLKISLIIISRLNMHNLNITDDYIAKSDIVEYHFKNIKSQILARKKLKTCDYVFDFTEGDSFSDLYGIKQLIVNSNLKLACINRRIPLILCPQTQGPFSKKVSQIIAKKIICNCYKVFTRDIQSANYLKETFNVIATTSIDVAFELPYEKNSLEKNHKLKIGINISGLLWNNGYTGHNEFGLQTNYKEYCDTLISYLINEKKYEIHLIPHVICEDYDNIENDLKVCNILKEKFETCIVPQTFITPMEVKSYIANMDIFIGARMHATIAAYSTNVAVIPFSYSRKFEGLFETLDYNYCINGKKLTTEQAIELTKKYINDYQKLANKINMPLVNKKLDVFKKYVEDLLKNKE